MDPHPNRHALDEEGIFHLQEALRISPDFNAGRPNPGNARVHDYLGSAFLVKGQRGEAIFHYERALLLRPTYNEVHDKLALLLSIYPEGRFRNGQRAVQQADQLSEKENPLVMRTLAAAYAESGP